MCHVTDMIYFCYSGVEVGDCAHCSKAVTCPSCLVSLDCGWCYNILNPTIGSCVRGDYHAPLELTCQQHVAPIFLHYSNLNKVSEGSNVANVTASDRSSATISLVLDNSKTEADYAYTSCPDLDECFLELHRCHLLATCTDKPGGYNCSCRNGYKGDGVNTCDRTCNVTCVHGRCSNAPNYVCQCDLGWTGDDCSIDCGCNNHSTCSEGVGKCDACKGNTLGDRCHLCMENSWGNATTPDGCQECSCNGHGDVSLGTCHRLTGQCYCTDDTRGRNCELCGPGFYGNPVRGGTCYRACLPRNVIYGATSGRIGAQISDYPLQQQHMHNGGIGISALGSDVHSSVVLSGSIEGSSASIKVTDGLLGNETETCLWIITPYKSIEPPALPTIGSNIIVFAVVEMQIACDTASFRIYDGVPDVVSRDAHWDRRNHVLASYCSRYSSSAMPLVVEARSGYLTVLLQRRTVRDGFMGHFEVLGCPDKPGQNRVCIDKKPVCTVSDARRIHSNVL